MYLTKIVGVQIKYTGVCSNVTLYTLSNRGEDGDIKSKKDFIQTARLIAKESDEVVKMAKKVADACTDKRMKRVS